MDTSIGQKVRRNLEEHFNDADVMMGSEERRLQALTRSKPLSELDQ